MEYEGNNTRINFSFNCPDDKGTYTEVTHSINGERAEYLPSIIEEFRAFLVHMGFTYVGEVIKVPNGYLITA